MSSVINKFREKVTENHPACKKNQFALLTSLKKKKYSTFGNHKLFSVQVNAHETGSKL